MHNRDHHCKKNVRICYAMDCEWNSDLVGIDEQSSAKLRATHWIKVMAIIHPQTIPRREIDISPKFCVSCPRYYLEKEKEQHTRSSSGTHAKG